MLQNEKKSGIMSKKESTNKELTLLEHLPPKKLIMNILDILRIYSDANHPLTQRDIIDILERDYSIIADRKSVQRNLKSLMEFGYDIEYTSQKRVTPIKNKKTGETVLKENEVQTDFYLVRDFDDSELRLLIDSLLFSTHLPYSQCKNLIEKLEGLSSVYFKSRVKHISTFPETKPNNKQLFHTIDILDEANERKLQVSFAYLEYGLDKKLHKKLRPDGTVREYIINPYQMAAKEGKYYLICNYDKYEDISNYRLDRITDIKILDTPVKPFKKLAWANERNLNLHQYMKEHIQMYSSESVRAKFQIPLAMISDIIDVFGTDVKFSEETDNTVNVSAFVNEIAMLQYAKTHSPDVVILSPQYLADKLKEDFEKSLEKYKKH